MKISKNIEPKSHPKHYLLHRYWGRKPHNVVNEYIKAYSKKGDTVLDPFQGSGVVIIESLKESRNAVGVDINPISCLLTKITIENINLNRLEKIFYEILTTTQLEYSKYYKSSCINCKNSGELINSIWEQEKLKLIKVKCKKCGETNRKANDEDIKLFNQAKRKLFKLSKENKIFYPKDLILQYVKRSGKTNIDQLYSERALLILGSIYKKILLIKNTKYRDCLMLCFSSMLSSVSKMIPGNEKNIRGRSGWVVSKLWVPKIHTEKNIFITFENRFKKMKEGKEELNLNSKNAKIFNKTSEKMNFLRNQSIDYVFTDPPYGESIAYLGLSMFWNSWLQKKVKYKSEIIYDPYRKKLYEDYELRMTSTFKEIYRVLKNKKYFSFSFHNRDMNIWRAVINAALNSGFKLININYQSQAVKSGTQGLNYKNTFYGDFIYNFRKETKNNQIKIHKNNLSEEKLEKLLIKKVTNLIEKNNNILTPDKLYEIIIPFIVSKSFYKYNYFCINNLDKFLSTAFNYKKILIGSKNIYGWQKKDI